RETEIEVRLVRVRIGRLTEVHQRRVAEREHERGEVDLRERLVIAHDVPSAHSGVFEGSLSPASTSSSSSSSSSTESCSTAAGGGCARAGWEVPNASDWSARSGRPAMYLSTSFSVTVPALRLRSRTRTSNVHGFVFCVMGPRLASASAGRKAACEG